MLRGWKISRPSEVDSEEVVTKKLEIQIAIKIKKLFF